MSKFIIYALHHPDSLRVYVGKTSKGLLRPLQHGADCNMKKNAHFPVVKWISKLRKSGKEYQVVVLDEYSSAEELNEAEIFYIAYFRSIGVPLLNCSDGGEGQSGFRPSAETIAKMTGRKLSVEHRAHIAASSRRVTATPEYRAKMSKVKKGQLHSAEHKAKLSAAAFARSTPEYRKRMSETQRARGCGPSPLCIRNSVMSRKLAKQNRQMPRMRINLLSEVLT